MTSFEHLTTNQKTRAALHRDVIAICSETCHFLGLEITKPAMEIVAQLVYKKLCVYGTDLEAFSKHAKRATINTEDVKLLVRRCPSLKSHLNTLSSGPAISKEKKRKTIPPVRTETPPPKTKEPAVQKQIEIETPVAKQRDTDVSAAILKEVEKEDNVTEKAENMSLDLIDLTFD